MENIYQDYSKILKALSDANRIKIIDILSCGEKCACEILEHFEFTQPTLSHHMKQLSDCGLVNSRKDGLWNHYSLNQERCADLVHFISSITQNKNNCICSNPNHIDCQK